MDVFAIENWMNCSTSSLGEATRFSFFMYRLDLFLSLSLSLSLSLYRHVIAE